MHRQPDARRAETTKKADALPGGIQKIREHHERRDDADAVPPRS